MNNRNLGLASLIQGFRLSCQTEGKSPNKSLQATARGNCKLSLVCLRG